jgi:hypothetical protein
MSGYLVSNDPVPKGPVSTTHLWPLRVILNKTIVDVVLVDPDHGFLQIVFDDGTTLDLTACGDYKTAPGYLFATLGTVGERVR